MKMKSKKNDNSSGAVFDKTSFLFEKVSEKRNPRILKEKAEKNMLMAIFFMLLFYGSLILSNYFFLKKIEDIEPLISYTNGKVEKIRVSKDKFYKMQESIEIIKEKRNGR